MYVTLSGYILTIELTRDVRAFPACRKVQVVEKSVHLRKAFILERRLAGAVVH